MSHRIRLAWVGGEHDFALALGQLRALQANTGAGPEELLNRMAAGTWRVDDLIETLRQGLLGGGVPAEEAGPLLLRLADLHGLIAFRETAFRVLAAALRGPKGDPVGERMGAPTPPAPGGSPASTESAP